MMIQLFGMLHSMSKRGPSILSALAASFTAVLVNLKSVDFIADLDDPKIVNDADAQRVCLDKPRVVADEAPPPALLEQGFFIS